MEGEAIAKKMCEDTMSRESFQQLKMYMMGCPDHLKIRAVGICCHTTDEFLTDRGIHRFFVPAITTGSFTGGVSGSVFTCS